MYDECGHDHCNRLKSEISMGATDGSYPATMELALWLWEVHNSVNERLMNEAAQRQNREVTHQETLASKFPTRKMCPNCWLDENMSTWDNSKVFHFLDDWFWPNHEPFDEQFMAAIAGTAEFEEGLLVGPDCGVGSSFSVRAMDTWSTLLFCCLLILPGVLVITRKKYSVKRNRRDFEKKNP